MTCFIRMASEKYNAGNAAIENRDEEAKRRRGQRSDKKWTDERWNRKGTKKEQWLSGCQHKPDKDLFYVSAGWQGTHAEGTQLQQHEQKIVTLKWDSMSPPTSSTLWSRPYLSYLVQHLSPLQECQVSTSTAKIVNKHLFLSCPVARPQRRLEIIQSLIYLSLPKWIKEQGWLYFS